MAFGNTTKLGLAGVAVALLAIGGTAYAPAPEQLPTVEVYHNPT